MTTTTITRRNPAIASKAAPAAPREPKAPRKLIESKTAVPELLRPKPALGKLGAMVHLMSREQGAALHELCDATGWQAHSVRGALAGSLKRQRGYVIASEKTEGVRRYRIAAPVEAGAPA